MYFNCLYFNYSNTVHQVLHHRPAPQFKWVLVYGVTDYANEDLKTGYLNWAV